METRFDMPHFEDMDEIDKKIITVLRYNGRESFSQIAKQLNVSPGMIRIRYNRLVELGYLQIVAITNPLNMGFNAMAMLGVRADGNKLSEIAEELSNMEEVVYLVITAGRFDLLVEVMCHDHADLLRFLTEKLYKIEGVKDSETFMNLKIVKEIYI